MIIDGHGHACGPYLSSDSIDRHLDEAGADLVVLTAGEAGSSKTYAIKDDTERRPDDDHMGRNNRLIKVFVALSRAARRIRAGNESVHGLAKANPRVLQYYWASGESVEELEGLYGRMRFRGLKLQQVWAREDLGGRRFDELEEWLAAKGLPLFIHLADRKDALALAARARRGLKTSVVVAHLYGFEALEEEGVLGAERLFFDVSNAYFVSRPRLERAVSRVGCGRLCLGSDTPYGEDALRRTIARIDSLALPDGEKAKILGQNLAELLRVDGAAARRRASARPPAGAPAETGRGEDA